MKILDYVKAVAAIFALTAFGVSAVQVTLLIRQVRDSEVAFEKSAGKIADHVDGTIADVNRTMQIAAGVLNQARQIERDNRADLSAVNRETLNTLRSVNQLTQGFDESQKRAAMSIEQTSAAILPVLNQTREDLAALEPAIRQVTPLLERTTDIAVNVSNATADVEHEIHKLVYPPPRKWYQKYFLDPLRTAAHLVTIPLR